jgi:hypothetical protein
MDCAENSVSAMFEWDLEHELAALDDPRPIPETLRARLEQALLRGSPPEENPLAGLDAPRELPAELDARLAHRLVAEASARPWPARLVALAAAILLVAGSLTAAKLASSSGPTTVAAGRPRVPAELSPGLPALPPLPAPSLATGPGADATASGAAGNVAGGTAGGGGSAAGGSAGAFSATSAPTGPPPPFSTSAANAAASPSAAQPSSEAMAAPAASAVLSIGVVRGDAAEEAGFNAYLRVLNEQGGIGGRRLSSVTTSAVAPASGTIGTVNLSGVPLGSPPPSWVTLPLLETEPMAEAALQGSVFDFSSAAEHQAHLAVDALFASSSPGATAVIYREPTGVLGNEVPAALAGGLRARGVASLMVTYRSGQPLAPVRADAVFLSLSEPTAQSWLRQANANGIHPPRGIAGVAPLLDASLLSDLPPGTTVVSPYALPTGAEADALSRGGGVPLSAAELHGWETAKSVAVALWRSGAKTPGGLRDALVALRGYSDALTAPYEVRPGTESRVPDGIVVEVQAGQFRQEGGFRTDPF